MRLERADAGDQRIVLLEEVAGNEVGAAVRVLKDGKARWGLGGHGLIGFGGMGHRGKGERRDQCDPAKKDVEKWGQTHGIASKRGAGGWHGFATRAGGATERKLSISHVKSSRCAAPSARVANPCHYQVMF